MISLKEKVAPAVEPLTVDELKLHLRVDTNEEDDLIRLYGVSARRIVEKMLGRSLIDTTWDMWLDRLPQSSIIELPKSPVSAINKVEIKIAPDMWIELAEDQYLTDLDSEPARLTTRYGAIWPSPLSEIKSIHVEFVAGMGSSLESIPDRSMLEETKVLIQMLVAIWYQNREPVTSAIIGRLPVPLSFQQLIASNRVYGGF